MFVDFNKHIYRLVLCRFGWQEHAQKGYEATKERVSTARAGQELLDKGEAAESAIRAKMMSKARNGLEKRGLGSSRTCRKRGIARLFSCFSHCFRIVFDVFRHFLWFSS